MKEIIIRNFFKLNFVVFMIFMFLTQSGAQVKYDKVEDNYISEYNRMIDHLFIQRTHNIEDRKRTIEILGKIVLGRKVTITQNNVERITYVSDRNWYDALLLLARMEQVERPRLTELVVKTFDNVYKNILKKNSDPGYQYRVWTGVTTAINRHGSENYLTEDFWKIVQAGLPFLDIDDKYSNKRILTKLMEIYPEAKKKRFIGRYIILIEAQLRYPRLKEIIDGDRRFEIAQQLILPFYEPVGDLNDLENCRFRLNGIKYDKWEKEGGKRPAVLILEKYGYGKKPVKEKNNNTPEKKQEEKNN